LVNGISLEGPFDDCAGSAAARPAAPEKFDLFDCQTPAGTLFTGLAAAITLLHN
jgi:hypothetical protein